MNRTDASRPAPESGGAVGLVEPIWRYQDACAIGLLPDEPAAGLRDEQTDQPDRAPRITHIRHIRAG